MKLIQKNHNGGISRTGGVVARHSMEDGGLDFSESTAYIRLPVNGSFRLGFKKPYHTMPTEIDFCPKFQFRFLDFLIICKLC